MLAINSVSTNVVNFGAKKEKKDNLPKISSSHSGLKTISVPTLAMLMYLNAVATPQSYTMENDNSEKIELVATTVDTPAEAQAFKKWDPTQLSPKELADAPSPTITIKGKELNAGIVVDRAKNRLYRYDENGKVFDGYRIATGVIGRKGESITTPGIRFVDEIETYPYKEFPGTKRAREPKAFGPKILHLRVINPKVGIVKDEKGKYLNGDNGEYIHGNNNASSIGKHASHGCMRMSNEVIKMMAEETPVGTYVLIK